jgi:hypothetical protein
MNKQAHDAGVQLALQHHGLTKLAALTWSKLLIPTAVTTGVGALTGAAVGAGTGYGAGKGALVGGLAGAAIPVSGAVAGHLALPSKYREVQRGLKEHVNMIGSEQGFGLPRSVVERVENALKQEVREMFPTALPRMVGGGLAGMGLGGYGAYRAGRALAD